MTTVDNHTAQHATTLQQLLNETEHHLIITTINDCNYYTEISHCTHHKLQARCWTRWWCRHERERWWCCDDDVATIVSLTVAFELSTRYLALTRASSSYHLREWSCVSECVLSDTMCTYAIRWYDSIVLSSSFLIIRCYHHSSLFYHLSFSAHSIKHHCEWRWCGRIRGNQIVWAWYHNHCH